MFLLAHNLIRNEDGTLLVEILLAIGLMAIIIPALFDGFIISSEGRPQRNNRIQATTLLREGKEALRSARESNWSNIETAGTYHPEVSGNEWALVSGAETVNTLFTRSIVISDVYRDSGGNIVTSGGTLDPSTKKAVTTVSWSQPLVSSVTATNFLSRFVGNTTWLQTTQAEFDNGTKTAVVSTSTSGGEIELATGSGGDWSLPTIVDTYDNSDASNGTDVFVSGDYAYLTTFNGGGSSDLTIIDVSDPTNVSETGTINLSSDVYDVFVSGDYAYVATSSDAEELKIIDVSNKSSPTQVDSVNLGGSENALSVTVSGNYAYVGKDSASGSADEIYVVDVSTIGSSIEVNSLDFGGNGRDVNALTVDGSYLYAASDNNNAELLIYDISTPTTPILTDTYNADSGANGEDVYVLGDYAFLVTGNNNGSSPDPAQDVEFYILDISDPSNISFVGSHDIASNCNGVFAVGDYAFIANDSNGIEFLVLDISTPSNPTVYGSVNTSGDNNGIFVSGDYAYVANEANSTELIVIEGGSGSSYGTSGDFTSQTFDAGSSVGFNYVTFSVSEPSGTDINFQIAVSSVSPPSSFVGPDGTGATFYESDGDIDLGSVSGQYFAFKAYLTGDGSNTPVLQDFTVNYSP